MGRRPEPHFWINERRWGNGGWSLVLSCNNSPDKQRLSRPYAASNVLCLPHLTSPPPHPWHCCYTFFFKVWMRPSVPRLVRIVSTLTPSTRVGRVPLVSSTSIFGQSEILPLLTDWQKYMITYIITLCVQALSIARPSRKHPRCVAFRCMNTKK